MLTGKKAASTAMLNTNAYPLAYMRPGLKA